MYPNSRAQGKITRKILNRLRKTVITPIFAEVRREFSSDPRKPRFTMYTMIKTRELRLSTYHKPISTMVPTDTEEDRIASVICDYRECIDLERRILTCIMVLVNASDACEAMHDEILANHISIGNFHHRISWSRHTDGSVRASISAKTTT